MSTCRDCHTVDRQKSQSAILRREFDVSTRKLTECCSNIHFSQLLGNMISCKTDRLLFKSRLPLVTAGCTNQRKVMECCSKSHRHSLLQKSVFCKTAGVLLQNRLQGERPVAQTSEKCWRVVQNQTVAYVLKFRIQQNCWSVVPEQASKVAKRCPSEGGLANQKLAKSVGRIAKSLHRDRFQTQRFLQQ